MGSSFFAILGEFWSILGEMSPYLLFGFLAAGLLSVAIPEETVGSHLGGRGPLSVLKAVVLGIPLPLCSCSVIPMAASLRRQGASPGATTAFLISTPQTGADSILVTLSLLGPLFAVVTPLAAFFGGLAGGLITAALKQDFSAEAPAAACCTDGCCAQEIKDSRLRRGLTHGFVTLPADIGRSLVLGIVAAGLISALVPPNFLAGLMGTGTFPKLVMMVVGMPVYVCATASVPVAAALIAKGVSPGAALVFLMVGPTTNVATIATGLKIMGRRATAIYVGSVAISALIAGTLLDYLFAARDIEVAIKPAWEMPGPVKTVSAVALLAVLAAAVIRSRGSREGA